MTFGGPNQDVLSGQTPIKRSPIPGLSNATWIVNRKYERGDIDFNRNPDKTGFQNFGKFIKQFTRNPKQASSAVALFKDGPKGGL